LFDLDRSCGGIFHRRAFEKALLKSVFINELSNLDRGHNRLVRIKGERFSFGINEVGLGVVVVFYAAQ
jgi:hypothetical protein